MSQAHSDRATERGNVLRPLRGASRLATVLLSLIAISACAQGNMQPSIVAPLAVQRDQSGDDTYKLDAGDKLRVIVFGELDLGGEYEVDGSGQVRLPLIGQVQAAGLAVNEFEGRVKATLEPQYLQNARVSVEVINYRPFYILGQVNKPGEYSYVNGMSVLGAVALAGGYTYRANQGNVYIRRRGEEEQRLAPADPATRVQPGDIITVRERFF